MRTPSASHLEKSVAGRKVLIDSNIIIYLTDSVAPYDVLSRRLFEMIENGDAAACYFTYLGWRGHAGSFEKGIESSCCGC